MNDLVFGLTPDHWTAIGAIAGAVAAAGACGAALISLKTSRDSMKLTRRIHRETGPLPVLTIWNHRDNSAEAEKNQTTHIFIIRVENQGRLKCSIKAPVVDLNSNGRYIDIDPRFHFDGPDEVTLDPTEHQDWTLNLKKLPPEIPPSSPVRIHVETVRSGGRYLRKKVLLNDSNRFLDRLPLLFK